MGLKCAVVGCKSYGQRDKNVSFYRFPKLRDRKYTNRKDLQLLSRQRQEAWIKSIKRGPLTASQLENFRVCQNHFISGKPADLQEFNHPDWVPCKNLGYFKGHALKSDASLGCYQRAATRAEKKNSKEVNATSPNKSYNSIVELVEEKKEDNICEDYGCIDQEHRTNEVSSNHISAQINVENHYSDEFVKELISELKHKDELVKELTSQLKIKDEYVNELESRLKQKDEIIEKLNLKIGVMEFDETSFKGNNEKTLFYTGLPNTETLFIIHDTVQPYLLPIRNLCALTPFQQLILSLIKLRLNLSLKDLSYRFGVSVATVARTFRKTINVMAVCFSKLIVWPDRETILTTQPLFFQSSKHITVIVDCFEIFIEGSDNFLANAESWSQYKHHKTIKVLIGITGHGSISFLSKAWGGRTSDKHIVENSGFLDHILPGDVVLADRGFLIQDSLECIGAALNIPAFTKGVNQLHPVQLEETRKMANIRIHVERVIGGMKNKFQILTSTLPVDTLYTDSKGDSFIDAILSVCGALYNLCPSIMPKNFL